MFISRLGATRQTTPPIVTDLQPVKDAINGMKARYRTNASLPLKPRIEASYAVFKEYVKDLPKDQKAASKQEFIKEMSTLLGIDSAPILALLQKKNEVSGPCVEAMVTAKNTQDAARADQKPSAIDVPAKKKDAASSIVSDQRKPASAAPATAAIQSPYRKPSADTKQSEVPPSQFAADHRKLPPYVAPAEEKRSETPPLIISTAGQNPQIVAKKAEEKLQTDMDQFAIAERSITTEPLGNAANTASSREALFASIRSIGENQSRSSSFDSTGSGK